MKDKYREGKAARERFEKTMAALFQVKKSELEKKGLRLMFSCVKYVIALTRRDCIFNELRV